MTLTSEIVVAIISSGALSALVSGIITLLRDRKGKKDGVAAGVQIVLYDRIKWLGKQHIKRGTITFEDLEDLTEMHRVYHDQLGGNGYLDKIMDEVKNLKIVERIE